jgi:sec-independent protein translocase protein TatC
MLLTPPDVISQVLLAIPMWFLYEVGIIIGSIYSKPHNASEQSTQSE